MWHAFHKFIYTICACWFPSRLNNFTNPYFRNSFPSVKRWAIVLDVVFHHILEIFNGTQIGGKGRQIDRYYSDPAQLFNCSWRWMAERSILRVQYGWVFSSKVCRHGYNPLTEQLCPHHPPTFLLKQGWKFICSMRRTPKNPSILSRIAKCQTVDLKLLTRQSRCPRIHEWSTYYPRLISPDNLAPLFLCRV